MMLGQAALAMWWDIAADVRAEFEHWHSHEHFAERLALPGFRRASRWADAADGEGFFVLYELARHEALHSPEYVARLNAPTEWSRRMMPHHRNMVRCQARVLESHGGAVSSHSLTVRFSPATGRQNGLLDRLREWARSVPLRAGLSGAHLLQTDAPPIPGTTEQALRGHADRAADWILIVNGYEPQVLASLRTRELSEAELQAAGARGAAVFGLHVLRLSMMADEMNAPESE